MSRTDEALYTGLSSASSRKVAEHRENLKESKSQKVTAIKPAEEVIFKMIDSEISTISEKVLAYVNSETQEDNLKATLMALGMYRDFLNGQKTTLHKIMNGKVK